MFRIFPLILWVLFFSTAQISSIQAWLPTLPSIENVEEEPAVMPSQSKEAEPVSVVLSNEEESIQAGRPFWLAVHLKIDKGWHAYWKNPGDSGLPPSIEWNLPEGFTAGPIQWPFPTRFTSEAVVGFGYEGDVDLLVQITPPEKIAENLPIEISADVRWLVCSDSLCLPGQSEASLTLPVAANLPSSNPDRSKAFSQARAQLPKSSIDFNWNIEAVRTGELIKLYLHPASNQKEKLVNVYFCPADKRVIDHSLETFSAIQSNVETSYLIILKAALDKKADQKSLKGVLIFSIGQDSQLQALEIDVPFTTNAEMATNRGHDELISMSDALQKKSHIKALEDNFGGNDLAPPLSAQAILTVLPVENLAPANDFEGGYLMALLLAFIGGAILNLMPCVLPVISFKILSFVKMAEKKRALVFQHGLAFSAGVLLSFWVLAALLLSLQAYGASVGWGFQLQEPLFVGILAALLLIFSISMFGVFEAGSFISNAAGQVKGKSEGLGGSFFSGILATLVATPCTGPFLGSAVGFAVTLSAPLAMLIFTMMGLGMAFPYLLLSAYPNLMRFLPKPGAWMETFKQAMGFVMLASVLWLVWVFAAQTDSLALVILLIGFFWMALGCWIYGRWGSPVKPRSSRIFSGVFSLACLLVGGYAIVAAASLTDQAPVQVSQEKNVSEKSTTDLAYGGEKWEAFSPKRLAQLQEQGVPVLIDFTAKWCLICQANHLVLSKGAVDRRFTELGVVRMKADWTKNDPVITQELRKHGRNSVPLYVLYSGKSAQAPRILPQVLTQDIVLNNLQEMKN